jgi:5-methylcytosine-specific restriction endonuclease McrA
MPVSRYTEDELRRAVLDSRTIREVLLRLNLRGAGSNYEVVRRNIRRLDIDTSHFSYTRGQRHLPPETLVAAVAAAKSYRSAVRSLGYAGTPSETRWLQRQVTAAGLDTSHFTGQGWRGGRQFQPSVPLESYLRRGSLVTTDTLRRRLLREGVLPRCCARCGLREWNGQSIPLELDHISGDRADNRLANLRILCPNCHAQTPTYRGRNRGAISGAMVE